MGSSMFDYLSIVWIAHGRNPDWDAMTEKAEAADDEDVTEGLARLRADWDSPEDRRQSIERMDLGPLDVIMGFDPGWHIADLDYAGVMEAGGFYAWPAEPHDARGESSVEMQERGL